MKTLETILKEHGVIEYDIRTNAAIAEYLNHFHPNPTEAEINEAAAKHAYNVFNTVHQGSNEHSFREAVTWLQNYQTQGSDILVSENIASLINGLKDRLSSQEEVQTSWVINHLDEVLNQLPDSQPNPAIAVIEERISDLKQSIADCDVIHCRMCPIHENAIEELENLKETIHKQIS